jgi:MFS transporter, DHA2 family, multidrug resistance protein
MTNAPDRISVVEYGMRRTIITAALTLATLLEIVDVTIVNVALPNIQGNFGASVDEIAWIGTGYIIANVIVIPLTPWLQRRFGRKQYYAASILLFTAASVFCGLSGSLGELVFWRIIQGVGGGGLISTSQAILRETYPFEEQGKAAGIFSMGVIVGPTIGPTLGGVITDNLSWRWAFFVNLPLGLIAAGLVIAFLRNPEAPRKIAGDIVGLALLAVGIGSLQYVLDQGQRKDWFDDTSITAFSCTALIGLIEFVLWELRTAKPIVELRVLRYPTVWAGSLLGMVLGISLYGTVLVLPLYTQGSLGFTATLSGMLLVMRAGAVLLCTPPIAILVQRGKLDTRVLVASGFMSIGISNLMLAAITTTQTPFWAFFGTLALSGVGLSQIFVPLTFSVLGSVSAREIPAAAAFFNLSRQLGGSIAIAVLVTILARDAAAYQERLSAGIAFSSPSVARYIQRQGSLSQDTRIHLYRLVQGQALVLAYADTARFTGYVSLLLAPLALILRRPRGAPTAAIAAE